MNMDIDELLTTARKPPRAPKGMQAAGRRLWRPVLSKWILRPDELVLLEQACRSADEVEAMRSALANEDPVIVGQRGSRVVHPLYSALRDHRTSLQRLLDGVGLAEADAPDPDAASQAGRALVARRWKS